jgi:hypothetical protein
MITVSIDSCTEIERAALATLGQLRDIVGWNEFVSVRTFCGEVFEQWQTMNPIGKSALVLVILSSGVLAAADSLSAAPTQTWRIELTSEVCGKNFAVGVVEVNAVGSANGSLTKRDGSKASFVAKLNSQNQIHVHFRDEENEAFELKGGFSRAKERGTWKSGT